MAKKKNTDLFDRAAQAVEDGDSATCQELITELRAEVLEGEREEWDRSRPSQELVPSSTGEIAERRPVGAEFEAAALAGDTDAAERLRVRYQVLDARRARAGRLIGQLRERQEAAEKEEERAAAPKAAKAAVKALDALLDQRDEARESLREAEGGLRRQRDELHRLLELAPGAAHLTPEQLWRLHSDEDGNVTFEYVDERSGQRLYSRRLLRDVERLLAPPDGGLLDRLRRWASRTTSVNLDPSEPRERDLRHEIDRTRARLIAAQRFEELADAERLAREAIVGRARPGRRESTAREVDGFLDRERDRQAARMAEK